MKHKTKFVFFNSYKGGVGRTFFMVNMALVFKHYTNKKILLIDMDMNAPGINSYFKLKIEKTKTLFHIIKKDKWSELPDIVTDIKGRPFNNSKYEKLFILPAAKVGLEFFKEQWDDAKNEPRINWYDKVLVGMNKHLRPFLEENNFDLAFFDFSAGFDVENIAKNILATPDLIFLVSNPNQQGFDGLDAYFRVLNSKLKERNAESKLKIFPILNKVAFEHPSFKVNENIFNKLISNYISELLQLDIIKPALIAHFETALIGEFNLEKIDHSKNSTETLFKEYKLDSELISDKESIFQRRLRGDGSFKFYETIFKIFKQTQIILYNGANKGSLGNEKKITIRSKINVLIEKTNYSEELIEKIKDDVLGEISLTTDVSENIIKAINVKDNNYISKYDIIALPNFCLTLAKKHDKIISLEYLIKQVSTQDFSENFIVNVRNRFPSSIINVDLQGKTYGIPFTNISSCIAFNSNKIKTEFISYEDILNNDELIWGMVNNNNAYSHYYEFQNILGSFNTDFYSQYHPNIIGRSNILGPNFDKALEIYLKLYQKSKKQGALLNSWNEVFDELNNKNIDACFLWTEQIPKLNYNEFKYCGIPTYNLSKHNQGEGWFIAPVKKLDDSSYKSDILTIFKYFSSNTFQKYLFNKLGSSSSDIVNENVITQLSQSGKLTNKEIQKQLFIQRILKSINPKANFYAISNLMYLFSELISESAKNECIVDSKQHILKKLNMEVNDIYNSKNK